MAIKDELTTAEKAVVEELLQGIDNREIAHRLGLSDKTVKNHLASVLRKTGASSRLSLTVMLYRERESTLRRELRSLKLRRASRAILAT